MTFHSTNFPQDPTWLVIYYLARVILFSSSFFFSIERTGLAVHREDLCSLSVPRGVEKLVLYGLLLRSPIPSPDGERAHSLSKEYPNLFRNRLRVRKSQKIERTPFSHAARSTKSVFVGQIC